MDDDEYWNSSNAKGFSWDDASDNVLLPSTSSMSISSNTVAGGAAADIVSFDSMVPGPATKPGLGRRPLKDRPAPQPPEAKDKRAGRKKAEDGYKKASDRAYKAFNQVRAG